MYVYVYMHALCVCLPISSEVRQDDLVCARFQQMKFSRYHLAQHYLFTESPEDVLQEGTIIPARKITLSFSDKVPFSPEIHCKNTHNGACLIAHAVLHTSSIYLKIN